MSITDPTWIAQGAEVAIDGGGIFTTVTFARIQRLTTTQIVLDDGSRFRREAPHRELSTASSRRARLLDPASAYVVNARARELLHNFSRGVSAITSGSGATIGGMDAEAVRETIGDLVDQLNTIRKEIDHRAGL